MQLHSEGGRADLTLRFLTDATSVPERLTRDLKAGDVRLIARDEAGDVALSLPPQDVAQARELGGALVKLARDLKAASVSVEPTEYAPALAGAALSADWRDERYKGKPGEGETTLHVAGLDAGAAADLSAVHAGVTLTRELVSAPANHLNPASLARAAQELTADGLEVKVWDVGDSQARGMNLLMAVAAGSADGPRLIRVTLPARGQAERVLALVGKGITFDTGGYSLKTAPGMYGMKNDMGGAGTVLGAMRALARLRDQLPEGLEVRAYVAAAENMVGPHAMRPGDIYRAANGKTVEVTNTDAEGRLVLADTLAVACDEGATEVIDLATLTGVKVSALGNDIAGLFSTDAALTAGIKAAAERAGEFVWELPLHRPYLKSYQKNTIADLKNSDMVPAGGSIKAALFLAEFVTRPWAHLDIAGNAEKDGAATGWGVGTLVEYARGGGAEG